MRGILRYPRSGAVEDLIRATELPGADMIPFGKLAEHYLSLFDVESAYRYASRAVELSWDDGLTAHVFGLMALCKIAAKAPSNEIESLLEKSIQLNPSADNYSRANYQLYKARSFDSTASVGGSAPSFASSRLMMERIAKRPHNLPKAKTAA